MRKRNYRGILVLIGAIVLALVLFWVGLRLLLVPSDAFTPVQLFLVGVGFVLSGIFMISSANMQGTLWISAMLVLSGFYLFGRAAGIIELAWLARIVGIAFWCAAGMILAVAWPTSKNNSEGGLNE